ncbi:TnsD family transposase [Psychrobacillus sp. NPDC096623]|uniref:TnsD family transposase n=1 Tax=Psychrobacillus sp. NPDC096623 TaxID=3364492 RepID=UPI0037F77157
MIGYFPSLYEDELLYSWLARYHEHTGNISPKRTLNEIFNSTNIVAVLDIPSNINKLSEALMHFNIPEVESLIQNHTLFKYYTFFQSETLREKIFNNMKFGGKPGSSHLLLGINASTINEWKHIRFCHTCSQENINNYGESYWHVSHQLPKSFYCIKHDELLVDSLIKARNKHKHQYVSANSNIEITQKLKPSFNSKTEQHLKMITRENNKLLELTFLNLSLDIEGIYKYLLQINGYATYFGKIDQQKLAEQLIKFYGVELLELLDSTVDLNNPSCWLKAITRKHRKAFHPIRHILLLNFFGVAVEELKDLVGKKYYPFGEAPYYCLNPAANHYEEKVVKGVIITSCTDTGKPVGTFKCECGFTYSRRGPDINKNDDFKVGRIKDFGVVWIQELNRLINIEGLSYKEVAKHLKCDIATVKKYVKLKPNDKDNNVSIKEPACIKALKEKEWIELICENPLLTITSIRRLNPALYTWHYRNNIEFLKMNKPKNKVEINPSSRIDWESRDLATLNQVIKVVETLYRLEKPIFVNKTNVGKHISNPSFIEKHLEKLPKTREYLIDNIESRIDFQVRRLFWSCNKIRENGEVIRKWKVRRMAGFKKTMDKKIELMLETVEIWGEHL